MSALFIIERVKLETKNDIHCLMNRVVLYGITMRPQWRRLRWTKGVLCCIDGWQCNLTGFLVALYGMGRAWRWRRRHYRYPLRLHNTHTVLDVPAPVLVPDSFPAPATKPRYNYCRAFLNIAHRCGPFPAAIIAFFNIVASS